MMIWKYQCDYSEKASIILYTLALPQDKQWDPMMHGIKQKHCYKLRFKNVGLCLWYMLTLEGKLYNNKIEIDG